MYCNILSAAKSTLLTIFYCSDYFPILLDQNFRAGQTFSEGGRWKCHTCSILTSFYSKICTNSFLKIMFNYYNTTVWEKKTLLGFLFFSDKVKTFYLRYTIIHVTLLANTSRKVKDAKMAQVL